MQLWTPQSSAPRKKLRGEVRGFAPLIAMTSAPREYPHHQPGNCQEGHVEYRWRQLLHPLHSPSNVRTQLESKAEHGRYHPIPGKCDVASVMPAYAELRLTHVIVVISVFHAKCGMRTWPGQIAKRRRMNCTIEENTHHRLHTMAMCEHAYRQVVMVVPTVLRHAADNT